MPIDKCFISKRFFAKKGLKWFEKKHDYKVTEIDYACSHGEIDFSIKGEKDFLMEKGFPKILARFFT